MDSIQFSVFTKPWQELTVRELGEFVHQMGFDGIEFPVRPGYQVEPENVVRDLPPAARELETHGVEIYSVAGPTDEATIVACGEAGVPVIRTMARIQPGESYMEAEQRYRREYDALIPLLEKHNVTIGVQNHCGRFVTHAVGLRALLAGYAPQHLAAVWDAAHEALSGGPPDLALDAIWPHLCMVNLKNALWKQTTGPEAVYAEWRNYWTGGRHGLCVWPHVIAELKERSYSGIVCLTAEYSDRDAVERLIAEDLSFARELFAQR
jgi:sugar phosphate isomerase/epimerase